MIGPGPDACLAGTCSRLTVEFMETTADGNTGILAIWNNCAPGYEAEYEQWYQTEHLRERLSVPGFRRGRRYEAVDGEPAYFTYYEVETPAVLQSDCYAQRINNPTPMTERIMSAVFTDMSRTVCRRAFSLGDMRGAYAATVRTGEPLALDHIAEWMRGGAHRMTVARVESWQAVAATDREQSYGEKLRGGDDKISSCLLVEALREADCRAAAESVCASLGIPKPNVGIYRLLCEMQSRPVDQKST